MDTIYGVEEKFDTITWHRSLIAKERYKPTGSSVGNRQIDDEAASDRARIIYSSAFRRLQHKTQVFTLSKDAAVRTRLTHSLEVASVGRWIAQRIVDGALRELGTEYGSAFVSLVETGCLAHDIGNPPFGHFGEAAIAKWFKTKWPDVAANRYDNRLQRLSKDFEEFDGNPQGTRILLRLQGRTREERAQFGMDLTYSQVLTSVKYPRGPLDEKKWKKAGFFESERPKVEAAWERFGFDARSQRRFPLAYIVEAADDISYCIGDMEDGIEQGIFTTAQFFNELEAWTELQLTSNNLRVLQRSAEKYREQLRGPLDAAAARDLFVLFKTEFTRLLINEAADAYGDGSEENIRSGTRATLLHPEAEQFLDALKGIARRFLYPADKVQRPFLGGLKVIHGLLDEFGRLLSLTQEQFASLRSSWRSSERAAVSERGLETLLPLLDGLPPNYLDVYDSSIKEAEQAHLWGQENWELFCRCHLFVDYLSGMTDDFAFNLYQVISGARLD